MKIGVAIAAATAVLTAASGSSAATVRCRIEKPARATYGSPSSTLYLSDLTATNLPKHRTLGGSPCATANWLAYEFEYEVIHKQQAPGVLETDEDEPTGAPPLEWEPWSNSFRFLECSEEREIATFVHGHQRVSMRTRLRYEELPVYCEAEGPGPAGEGS
jgi:hypothetical protein